MSIKKITIAVFVLGLMFGIIHFWFAYPLYFDTPKEVLNDLKNDFFVSNANIVFTEQLKFREQLIAEYKRNISAIKDSSVDSLIENDPVRNRIGIRYLLPNLKSKFSIGLNNYTLNDYLLVSYDTLYVEYSLDDEKINSIIQNLKVTPDDFINVLKFQDYLKTEVTATFHQRTGRLIVLIGVACFLLALVLFMMSDTEEPEEEGILTESSIERHRRRRRTLLIDVLTGTEHSKLSDLEKSNYKQLEKRFERELRELQRRNKAYFIIERIVSKAEIKSRQVQNGSNLMLVSGLVMAFIGVVVFYFTLPSNISTTTDLMKIMTLSVRPTLILVFIEAVSWYLLKQHKVLLDDYKYYHSIYNKKVGYLAAYKLVTESQLSDEKLKSLIPVMILSEEIKKSESNKKDDVLVETSSGLLTSLFDKLMTKL